MGLAMSRLFQIILLLSFLGLAGCTEFSTLQRDGSRASNPYGLAVGDTVLLVTQDSQHYEFRVTQISDTAVIGEHVEIPFEQIKIAQKQEYDEVETLKAVGMTAFYGVVIALCVVMLIGIAAAP